MFWLMCFLFMLFGVRFVSNIWRCCVRFMVIRYLWGVGFVICGIGFLIRLKMLG